MKRFFIFFIILFVAACSNDKLEPTINSELNSDEIPSQESWNSVIQFSEDGRIKAILYADHLYVYNNQKVTYLDGVKIDFYNEAGKKHSTLTSKKGKVDEITKNMYAIDDVVAVSDSGVVLKTEELIWKNKEKKITTDKFVTIDDGDDHMEGYGFISDENLTNYTIYKVTYITTKKN